MNDFTKEELEYMSDILKIHTNDYPTLTSRDSDFLIKIQSIIDNYKDCKHDFIPFPGGLALSNCKKCGASIYAEDCEHEHDGKFYDLERGMSPKCIKCGEFYR